MSQPDATSTKHAPRHAAAKRPPKRADSRDMYAVHIMFRREFTELPGLILAVSAGDRVRARIVAGHVELVTGLLHVHHGSEDVHCWPKLTARCPDDLSPVVGLMESQHQAVATLLQRVERENAEWRESAAAAVRDRLADAVAELKRPLNEHLEAEEKHMLPLIDRYLTADEWANVGNKGLGNVPRSKVPCCSACCSATPPTNTANCSGT